MCGTAAREASHMPRRLTAIMRSHSSISISSKGERDIGTVAKIAALFTRTSIRPNASTARFASAEAMAKRAAVDVDPHRDRLATLAPQARGAGLGAACVAPGHPDLSALS